ATGYKKVAVIYVSGTTAFVANDPLSLVFTQSGNQGSRELYDSLAILKLANLSVGLYARTAGYFAPGDGGGADYQIVAGGTGTADDAFYANMTNGNQAKLLLPDPARMHVRQLGCVAGPLETDYASLPDDTARIAIGEASAVQYF